MPSGRRLGRRYGHPTVLALSGQRLLVNSQISLPSARKAVPLSASPLPDAVFWDMDGTLVDTEPYWIDAEYALVEEYGGTWSQELAHELVGKDLLVSAQLLLANSPVTLSPAAVVESLLGSVVERVASHVPWRPGARELLAELGALGVPCALVTMSWTSLARVVLEALPPGTFAHVVTGDLVKHGKPHPEPYLAAAAALGVDPSRCLAIEDSATGVQSAVTAGVPTLCIPHTVPVPPMPGVVHLDTLQGLRADALTSLFSRRQA